MDSNDNVPEFPESRYEFSVAEDAEAETVIGVIQAEDPDSGSFGEISYSIKGFGSEKFSVRELTGEVITIYLLILFELEGFTKNGKVKVLCAVLHKGSTSDFCVHLL